MMAMNKGKAFEARFKEDWKRAFPNSFLFRIPDQMNGYLTTSQNPCDFIAFTNRTLFLIECKSHEGTSIPFTAIPQYERLLRYKDIEYIKAGIIVWFIEHDKVIWVPIAAAEKIYTTGHKSIQLKMLGNDEYNILEIPSIKKRVFMESEYSILAKE